MPISRKSFIAGAAALVVLAGAAWLAHGAWQKRKLDAQVAQLVDEAGNRLPRGQSGTLAVNSRPLSGQTKLTVCACRNMRCSPSLRSSSLAERSPYLSSPATGWPA